MNSGHWKIDDDRLKKLLIRCELLENLLIRDVEEAIASCVPLENECVDVLRQAFLEKHNLKDETNLKEWLAERQWCEEDFTLHITKQESLRRFAKYNFGAGIEETFLQRKQDLDTVVYSMLRVRDEGLAKELWIQLSEGEVTFAEASSRYSDGPEALTKGVLGPFSIGSIQREVADRLRHLKKGELPAPEPLGPWWILFRLEQLTPAKLDDEMRERLLQEKLNAWIKDRCDRIRRGVEVEALDYDI